MLEVDGTGGEVLVTTPGPGVGVWGPNSPKY